MKIIWLVVFNKKLWWIKRPDWIEWGGIGGTLLCIDFKVAIEGTTVFLV